MGFFADVFCLEGGTDTPLERSCTGKFVFVQGLVYVLQGLSQMICPRFWALVMLVPDGTYGDLNGGGYFRAFGFVVSYIGVMYLFAGLADNLHFAAVSAFTRPVLAAMFLGVLGGFKYIPLPIAIYYSLIDSMLALLTLFAWKNNAQQRQESGYFDVIFCLKGGPRKRSFVGQFLFFQGVIYVLHGLSKIIYPQLWALVMLVPGGTYDNLNGSGYFRAIGFGVLHIGVIYLFQGYADDKHFAAVSAFMRPALVPTIWTICMGGFHYIPLPLAVYYGLADPSFALLTFLALRRTTVNSTYDLLHPAPKTTSD